MSAEMLPIPRRVAFTVPAEPTPQARPRVAMRGGRPHAYQPTRSALAQWAIRQAAIAALGADEPLSGPVNLAVTAYLRQPSSIPKRDRLTALPTRRPDLDNFLKLALDGCSPLWADDSQVVTLQAAKRYAVTGSPRWEIVVEAVG